MIHNHIKPIEFNFDEVDDFVRIKKGMEKKLFKEIVSSSDKKKRSIIFSVTIDLKLFEPDPKTKFRKTPRANGTHTSMCDKYKLKTISESSFIFLEIAQSNAILTHIEAS